MFTFIPTPVPTYTPTPTYSLPNERPRHIPVPLDSEREVSRKIVFGKEADDIEWLLQGIF